MTGLQGARRRYAALRARLGRELDTDRGLRDQLSATIRALDAKIAAATAARRAHPGGAIGSRPGAGAPPS